jgi:hypothetical protein
MKITVRVAKKTEYVEKTLNIVKIEKRVPTWINPNACCPVCKWRFIETHEKFATVVELENGDVEWLHEDCLK